jgi:formylmethanofuran dehydrogenase subunit E
VFLNRNKYLAKRNTQCHTICMKLDLNLPVSVPEHSHEMVICDVCTEWTEHRYVAESLTVCPKCVDWKKSKEIEKIVPKL